MSRSRLSTAALIVALFSSGFCGISYEVLYGRLLSDVFGGQFTVSAAILVTFLLGIAVGTRFAHRLAGRLWAVEGGIGLYALAFLEALPLVDRAVYRSSLSHHLGFQIGAACALLIVPSVGVGASLPLFSQLLEPLVPRRVFSLAYMVYNFGAALTALGIEFVLIRAFGIRATVCAIASINLLLAALLFAIGRRPIAAKPAEPRAEPLRHKANTLAALACVSVASAIFQLFMLKLTQFVFGPFRETFAMVLFVVLLGIALGAVLSHLLAPRFATFVLLNLVAVLGLLALCRPILFAYASHQGDVSGASLVAWRLAILFALMGPAATCFGAAIPALMRDDADVARESGALLSISSLANAAGYLLWVFAVHEALDYGQAIALVAALLALAFVLHLAPTHRGLALVGPLVALAAIPLLRTTWREELLYGSHLDFTSRSRLERALASRTESRRFRRHDEMLAVNTAFGAKVFNLNGYMSISTAHLSEHLVGLMSTLVAPRLDASLVLGLGTGSTAGTVAEYFGHTDVVEISPLVIEHQDLFAGNSFDIARKPTVDLVADDGIRYLKRTPKRWDLIVNTVTSPQYFSSSKLYTAEFLDLVKSRLASDGVYTTWVDTGVGNRGVGIIVRTLAGRFAHCWIGLMRSGYQLLLCSDAPLGMHQDGVLERNERVRRYFAERGRSLELVRYALVSDDAFGLLDVAGEAPENTLDRPTLEFEVARLSRISGRTWELTRRYVLDRFDPARLERTLFAGRPIDWLDLALYHSQIDRSSSLTDGMIAIASRHVPDLERRLAERRLSALFAFAARYPGAGTAENLGFELFDRGRWAESIDWLRRSIEADPNRDEVNLTIGKALVHLGRDAEAPDWFRRELAVDPTDREARAYLTERGAR